MPESLIGNSTEAILDSLDEFWESEHPRFGECESKGWENWIASGNQEYASAHSPPSNIVPSLPISDHFQKWAAEERDSDLRFMMPTRSTDETDDPYSTVLFSDIRPLLVPVKTSQAKRTFRLIWLSFLGLYVPGFSKTLSDPSGENWDDRWCYTCLIQPAYIRALFPMDVMTKRQLSDARSGAMVGRERVFSKGSVPIKNWGYGAVGAHEALVETNWTKRDLEHVDEGFIRRIFRQCRVGNNDREWDSFTLVFENVINNKRFADVTDTFFTRN